MSTKKDTQSTEEQDYNEIENEAQVDHGTEETSEDQSKSKKEEEKQVDPLTELQMKYDSLNDKYLRLYSEFENYRRRTAKEKLDSGKVISAELLRSMLPVMDDFDRAIAGNEHDSDLDSVKEGFKLIRQKFLHLLEQKGVKPMDAMEKPFDTEYHEAITNIPAPEPELKGKVVDVAEKGYFYKDEVLRYAKVVVGQ